jgi:hypothetical protein
VEQPIHWTAPKGYSAEVLQGIYRVLEQKGAGAENCDRLLGAAI